MHTIKQIISNQTIFKDEITSFLLKEQSLAKKQLVQIKTDDKYINKEKKKLSNRFKQTNAKKYIEKLFFLNRNRSLVFYAWWDDANKEVKILKYEKR
jgi:hypothetical protein